MIAESLIDSSLTGVDSTKYYVFRNIRIGLKRAGFSSNLDNPPVKPMFFMLELMNRRVNTGINQWWTANDCKQVAVAMTKVFDAFYTRDSKDGNWLELAGSIG